MNLFPWLNLYLEAEGKVVLQEFYICFLQVGRQAAAAVVFKGAIYLLGGESLESRWSIWKNDCYFLFLRSGLSSCEVLNPGAGVWQEAPPMHLARVGPSS